MGIEPSAGETYRLIVAIDRRMLVADPRRYSRFEDAQAEVARAVRRYNGLGPVSAVALQRGRPSRVARLCVERLNDGDSSHGTPRNGDDYLWTIEKRWGRDVVARILAQGDVSTPTNGHPRNGNSHPRNGNGHPRNGNGHPRNGSVYPRNGQRSEPRQDGTTTRPPQPMAVAHRVQPVVPRHKRWQILTTLAVILLSMSVLVLIQTGGHPLRLLAAFRWPENVLKEELPFDFRTSFAPESTSSKTTASPPQGS